MKKIVLLAAVAVMAGGMAWAQNWPGDVNPPDPPPRPDLDRRGPDAGVGFTGRVNLNSVRGPLSVDARSSAGRFTSDIDRFIDPRFHNPELGNFFFLGSDFGAAGSSAPDERIVNFGFTRNMGDLYLAFYYGGSFVNAAGYRIREDGTLDIEYREDERFRNTHWNSNMALLLGVANMGIRLDIVLPGLTRREFLEEYDADDLERTRHGGSSFALTWGADMGDLRPWARIGLRMPTTLEVTRINTSAGEHEARTTGGNALEIAGGARFAMSEASWVGGELWLGSTFRDRVRTSPVTGSDTDTRTRGMFGFGLGVYYMQNFDMGLVGIRLRPTLDFGLTNRSNNVDNGSSNEFIGDRWTTLRAGLDLGVGLQMSERIVLFTGTAVRVFDWSTWRETGRDDSGSSPHPEGRESAWSFRGITTTGINFGMSFTPVENVNIGIVLNPFVNGLFGVITGTSGPLFDYDGPTFNLTLSARLGGNGGGRAPAPAPAAPPADY